MFIESKLIELLRHRKSDGTIYKIIPKVIIIDSDHGERVYDFVCEGLELENILAIQDKQMQKQAFIDWVKPLVSEFYAKWMNEVTPVLDILTEVDLFNTYGDTAITEI